MSRDNNQQVDAVPGCESAWIASDLKKVESEPLFEDLKSQIDLAKKQDELLTLWITFSRAISENDTTAFNPLTRVGQIPKGVLQLAAHVLSCLSSAQPRSHADILSGLKEIAESNRSHSSFSLFYNRVFRGRDKRIENFYQTLAQLSPADTSSLDAISTFMGKFEISLSPVEGKSLAR